MLTSRQQTAAQIEQWEEAWSDYVFALEAWDAEIVGDDAVYWAGIAGRRLREATARIRQLSPDLCRCLGIGSGAGVAS